MTDPMEQQRAAFFATLGTVDDERLAMLMPVVPWPASNGRWAVIRSGATTLVASDGLSDRAEGEDAPGFGVEIVMATDEPVEEVRASWLFAAVAEVSTLVADFAFGEDLRPLIDELGSLSISLSSQRRVPDEYVADDGSVGVLLGVRSPAVPASFESPAGPVKILVARLLKANELAEIIEEGESARKRWATAFEAMPAPHLESLARPSFSARAKAAPAPLLDERRAEVEPPSGPSSELLLVSGLGKNVTADDLREIFSAVGAVKDVKLGMMNRVEMASPALAEAAVTALHGRFVRGQPITLAYMRRMTPR